VRPHPQRGEIWRHVDSNRHVRILYLARDAGTNTELVVYQNVNKEEDSVVRVMQLVAFMEPVDAFGRPRFERKECDR
jgi:hypothetical protein